MESGSRHQTKTECEASGYVQSSFKFDRDTDETIGRLRAHLKAATKAEVVRKAIHLLELVREIEARGGGIATVDSNSQITKLRIL